MLAQTSAATLHAKTDDSTLIGRLNSQWHERALWAFMVIVLAHWGEHLFQAFQIYVLGWPPPQSLGMLGMVYPWLVKSELMHYGYALIMLVCIWILRSGFTGQSYKWWMVAFWIQFWHHIEHFLLQAQAIAGENLFNSPVPVSIAQLVIPRVELHLIYNSLVFIPMVIAMYYHMFPSREDATQMTCSCAVRSHVAAYEEEGAMQG